MGSAWLHFTCFLALWSFCCHHGGKVSAQNQWKSSVFLCSEKIYLLPDSAFLSLTTSISFLLTTFLSLCFLWPRISLGASYFWLLFHVLYGLLFPCLLLKLVGFFGVFFWGGRWRLSLAHWSYSIHSAMLLILLRISVLYSLHLWEGKLAQVTEFRGLFPWFGQYWYLNTQISTSFFSFGHQSSQYQP